MSRTCTICKHENRKAIEKALVNNESLREVSKRFGGSVAALQRHKETHLPASLSKAKDAREVADADSLLTQVKALQGKATSLLIKAERQNDLRTALSGVREARACIELLAKLMGELDERPQINIMISSQWIEIRTLLIEALTPYPEARAAAARALEHLR